MLGPELAERFFQLLDPLGRPDPRLLPRTRSKLPLSAEALRSPVVTLARMRSQIRGTP